jgi:hypothetical protein
MKKLFAVAFLSLGLISGVSAQNSDIVINAYSDAIIDLMVLSVLAFVIFKLLRSKNNPKSSTKDTANFWAACGGFLGTISAGALWHQNNGVDFDEFVLYLFVNMMIFPTTAYILGLAAGFMLYRSSTKKQAMIPSENTTQIKKEKTRINKEKLQNIQSELRVFEEPKINDDNEKDATKTPHEKESKNLMKNKVAPSLLELEAYKEAYEEFYSEDRDISTWAFCFSNSVNEDEAKKYYIHLRIETILLRKGKESDLAKAEQERRKEEAKLKQEEEVARKKKEDEEARLKKQEEELARKKKEDEEARLKKEQEKSERRSKLDKELLLVKSRSQNLDEMKFDFYKKLGIKVKRSIFIRGIIVELPEGRVLRFNNIEDLAHYYVSEMNSSLFDKYSS